MEIEENHQLAFLDLLLIVNKDNLTIGHTVFRKNTLIDTSMLNLILITIHAN